MMDNSMLAMEMYAEAYEMEKAMEELNDWLAYEADMLEIGAPAPTEQEIAEIFANW